MSRIAGRHDLQDNFLIMPILPLCDPAYPVFLYAIFVVYKEFAYQKNISL